MDKSQFTIPEGEFNDASNRARLEAARTNPERVQAPFHFVTDLEHALSSFRDTAVALEQSEGREIKLPIIGLSFKLSKPLNTSDIYKKLINKEPIIGGRMFYPKGTKDEDIHHRFWFGLKGSSPISTQTGDWYFQSPNPQDPRNPYLMHIETSPHELLKFHSDGRPYPMTIEEIQWFVRSAYHYTHEVLNELYPFDATRVELLNDIEVPDDISALLPPEHTKNNKSDYRLAA